MKTLKQIALSLVLCCACAIALIPAYAQDRGINFTTVLHGFDGKAITGPDGKTSLTLGDVAVGALETPIEEDRNMAGSEKFKRDQLARKIYGAKSVELSVEEVALVKERIGKVYGPIVVGPAWSLLDPTNKK